MKNKTQIKWVKDKLTADGFVTRNEALKNFISRLGAIILNLKNEGWQIEGNYLKTEYGKDYKYTVSNLPKKATFREHIKPDGSIVMLKIFK